MNHRLRMSHMDHSRSHDGDVLDLRQKLRGVPALAPDTSPDALLVAVARGDRDAFTVFYDQLIGRIYGVVRSVVRDPAQSEEVAQDVMLELWRIAPRYEPAMGKATTWALTIAHRRAVDRVRSAQASRERETRHVEMTPVESAPDAATSVEIQLDRERVQRALTELTPTQRESVELAYFGGHSHSEVAALLNLPLGTVKTRIRDGLIRLRDRLEVST